MGLTIAVVGLLRAQTLISPSWFWAWNFVAEGLAVVALCLTIISVGSGFYPMTKDRNLYWHLSMGIVVIFGLATTANAVYYIQQKLIYHPITGDQVLKLRDQIIAEGTYTAYDLWNMRMQEQRQGMIPPGDAATTGVSSWAQLAWLERDMFARPSQIFYLAHQFTMVGVCAWVCFYLFIPLVRHHRHGPVGRPVDSDMVAIGVWYLTCLLTLACFYTVLNVIYCVWEEIIFKQQAQALDLCLRITIGPIFFVPAPKSLLQFYRDRFQKFKGNSSAERNDSAGRNWGSERNCFSSFNNISSSPGSTRVESGHGTRNGSVPRGSFDIKYQEPTSPSGAFSRIKLFHGRDRGHSVESSRVLSKDFECESANSQHMSEDRPDSCHQRYSGLDINQHPLRNSVVLYEDSEQNTNQSYDSQGEGKSFNVDEPQQPRQVLMEQHIRTARNNTASSKMDMELMPMSPARGIDGKAADEGNGSSNMQADDADKRASNSSSDRTAGYSSTEGEQIHINEGPANYTLADIDIPFESLTGLQRQLAEHRSALLPKVIAFKAYHDDLATAEPFDHAFQPSSISPDSSELHRSVSGPRPSKTFFRRQIEDDSTVFNTPSKSSQSSGVEPESRSSSHIADSVIRSAALASPRCLPEAPYSRDGNDNANYSSSSKPRDNKVKEGLISAFSRKALTSNGDSNSNNHADVLPETNQSPVAATVEELAQCSVLRSGSIDPYDSRIGFKRAVETTSHSDPKSPSSSTDSKGASAQSLGSPKSRDSLSKSSMDSKDSQKGPKVLSSPKSSSRKVRSKSDGTQQEKPHVSRAPPVDSPSTFARPTLPNPVEPPMVPSPIVKASLSPPPRQSWQRSKSFKNTVPTIATAASIDASRTSENDPTTGNTLSSASDATSSSSSLQNSPTNIVASSEEVYPQRATSPLGLINQSQGYRGNSQEYNGDSRMSRERERTSPLSPSVPGFSTRLNSNHHQRSVDNLASAYYYKRASELNTAPGRSSTFTSTSQPPRQTRELNTAPGRSSTFTSTGQYSHGVSPTQPPRQTRELNGIAIPSSLYSSAMSPTLGSPPSPNIRSPITVNGYVDSYGHGANGRDSPSPTYYGRGGLSPSITMAEQSGTSLIDLSTSESRSNSFTNSYGSQARRQSRLLGDDPWTLAMVNRAQAQSASTKPSMDRHEASRDRAASPTMYSESIMRPTVGRTTSE
ncbi:hypothetical protein BGX26_000142 [Mortierella sp. AD094]|nr:hypothetical protein BGX26_000142 [Mortierella sp. AD094]